MYTFTGVESVDDVAAYYLGSPALGRHLMEWNKLATSRPPARTRVTIPLSLRVVAIPYKVAVGPCSPSQRGDHPIATSAESASFLSKMHGWESSPTTQIEHFQEARLVILTGEMKRGPWTPKRTLYLKKGNRSREEVISPDGVLSVQITDGSTVWTMANEGGWKPHAKITAQSAPAVSGNSTQSDARFPYAMQSNRYFIAGWWAMATDVIVDSAQGLRVIFRYPNGCMTVGCDSDSFFARTLTTYDAEGKWVWQEDRTLRLEDGHPIYLERIQQRKGISCPGAPGFFYALKPAGIGPGNDPLVIVREVCDWRIGKGTVNDAEVMISSGVVP